MSTIIRDLWPDDINAVTEQVITPEEILAHQANQLEIRTNGLLTGSLAKVEAEDRIVIGFEIESKRSGRKARLFEVHHRVEFEYPARVIPPNSLPSYLKDRVYKRGAFEDVATPFRGRWEKNDWVVSSPTEFADLIGEVLDKAEVKAMVLSLCTMPANGSNGSD